eukprot:TRINITY_DN2932_c0_g1_i3.p1 TRINITY_DN2932_c0_g1~~TRINITY_DN2932_c0_g1_i3.p1  ORF type:complete len:285 (+),score=11.88 TRINITY_DN2932_c0_g1_i3:53-856(+)
MTLSSLAAARVPVGILHPCFQTENQSKGPARLALIQQPQCPPSSSAAGGLLIRRVAQLSSSTARKPRHVQLAVRAQAAATREVTDIQAEAVVNKTNPECAEQTKGLQLACPICFGSIKRHGPEGFSRPAVDASRFECPRCIRSFPGKQGYADLTVLQGAKQYADDVSLLGTELFRSPLISYVYERGWRQTFARSGFPEVEQEFAMAQRYLEPAAGGVLLDVSCGSGLFTRRFAASGKYPVVVGSDFSESMLVQTRDFISQDKTLNSE